MNLLPTNELDNMINSLSEMKQCIEKHIKSFSNDSLKLASQHLTTVISILLEEKVQRESSNK